MICDPRDASGLFGQLLEDLLKCKERNTCPALTRLPYYFEPNPKTTKEWRKEGMYLRGIDPRVVFVCESPGGSGRNRGPREITRCFIGGRYDRRFQDVRVKYGLQNCYITNTVKCGVRKEKEHSGTELDACIPFLIQELELIQPRIAVGVGENAMRTLMARVAPQLDVPLCFFEITHYSMRGDPWEKWNKEFPELLRRLWRLRFQ